MLDRLVYVTCFGLTRNGSTGREAEESTDVRYQHSFDKNYTMLSI